MSGGLHAVSQGWCWNYLDAILVVSEGVCSSVPSGRASVVRGRTVGRVWL